MSSTKFFIFFFNDTPTTEIYTLSLHDALPISGGVFVAVNTPLRLLIADAYIGAQPGAVDRIDRKSTRLNSSHSQISYAVFCLKKKKTKNRKNKQHIVLCILYH